MVFPYFIMTNWSLEIIQTRRSKRQNDLRFLTHERYLGIMHMYDVGSNGVNLRETRRRKRIDF